MNMNEHKHEHPLEANLEPSEQVKAPPYYSFQLIAGSILLSAVLICASIFYNTKLVVQKMSLGASPAGQQANDQNPSPSPAAPAPVSVNMRSDAPALGKNGDKLTIIEFGDFQCPFCKQFFQKTYNQIKAQYIDTGKIKYIFRHFPLPIHNNAEVSGVAAECANSQGKFWQYHDLLYTNGQSDGTNLAAADLKKYADSLGLNSGILGFGKNKFNQCLDSNAKLDVVNADQKAGEDIGVGGTPSFLVIKNGQLVVDSGYIANQQALRKNVIPLPNGDVFVVGAQPFTTFKQVIDNALK